MNKASKVKSIFLAYQYEDEDSSQDDSKGNISSNDPQLKKKKKKRVKKNCNEDNLLKELAMCSVRKSGRKGNRAKSDASGKIAAKVECQVSAKKDKETKELNRELENHIAAVEATSTEDDSNRGPEFLYAPETIQISRADGKVSKILRTSDIVHQLLSLTDQNDRLRICQKKLQDQIALHQDTIQQLRHETETYRRMSLKLQVVQSSSLDSGHIKTAASPIISGSNTSYRAPPPGMH